MLGHPGAAAAINCCARLALLAFSTSVRLDLHVYTVLIWYSALLRHCGISERGKEVAQALLIPLGVVHARLVLTHSLSFSFLSLVPLLSRELYLARANLYTITVRSHALEHAREPWLLEPREQTIPQ